LPEGAGIDSAYYAQSVMSEIRPLAELSRANPHYFTGVLADGARVECVREWHHSIAAAWFLIFEVSPRRFIKDRELLGWVDSPLPNNQESVR
jgi:hypothetical protein